MALMCVTAVSFRKYSGFKHTSGFYCQYHVQNEGNPQPQTGDFVEVNMALRAGDEVISPMTRNNMLVDDLYHGDIYSALRKMHLGDSATSFSTARSFTRIFSAWETIRMAKRPSLRISNC